MATSLNKLYEENDEQQKNTSLENLSQSVAQGSNGYQSQWQNQINDLTDRIINRKDFSYDPGSDALFQQYKDRYVSNARMGMMDTIGQANALTGGYGNSYSQSVGQQQYQNIMSGLNDKIPQLYQIALDKYNADGDRLLNQYNMYLNRDADDYAKWKYQQELDMSNRNSAYSLAMQIMQAGGMPSDELLGNAGISAQDANTYLQSLAAATASKKGSSGGGGSGAKMSDINATTEMDIATSAIDFYNRYPGRATDTAFVDNWLSNSGLTASEALIFKQYLRRAAQEGQVSPENAPITSQQAVTEFPDALQQMSMRTGAGYDNVKNPLWNVSTGFAPSTAVPVSQNTNKNTGSATVAYGLTPVSDKGLPSTLLDPDELLRQYSTSANHTYSLR